MNLIKNFRIIKRFRQIISAFFKAGFGSLITKAGMKKHVYFSKRFEANQTVDELPVKFRETLEKLGPVFVKFGQILSTRADLLPKEYILELAKLQAKVPPFPFEQARETIESELKGPLDKLFSGFEPETFASASLGQVYKAKLPSGEIVAVKVRRPKAKEQVELDTEVLLTIAHLAEKYLPEAKKYNLIGIVQEFQRWTLNELDYRKEATNCEIFTNFFREDENIYGPKVYWDYSSESVLTLEFVEGQSLANAILNKKTSVKEKSKLAHLIADAFTRQFFDYGFFHADPHPGNIFILSNQKIFFLDFGMVGFLDGELMAIASAMFIALVQKDIQSLVDLFCKMEEKYDERANTKDVRAIVNVNSLRKELSFLSLQISSSKEGQSGKFTKIFYEMLRVAVKNGVGVPIDLIMLSKAVVTLDVVMQQLDPAFRMEEWEKPVVERIMKKKLAIKNVQSRVQSAALIVEDLIKRLPATSANIVDNLERGRFGMEVNTNQLMEYERLLNANSRFSTYGMMFASLVIASALIYQSGTHPIQWKFTIPGWGLYVGFGLIIGYFFFSKRQQI